MRYVDLSNEMQEFIRSTNHNSSTIQCDISDALENATDEENFVKGIHNAMEILVEEATQVWNDAETVLRTNTDNSEGE